MTPHDVGSRARNFAHDALELDRAARLVDLLLDHSAMVIHHLNAGNFSSRREKKKKERKEGR